MKKINRCYTGVIKKLFGKEIMDYTTETNSTVNSTAWWKKTTVPNTVEIGDFPHLMDPAPTYQPFELHPLTVPPIYNNFSGSFSFNPFSQLVGKKVCVILHSGSKIEGEVVQQPNVLDDNFLVMKTEQSSQHYFPKTSIESFYVVEEK